ncbi:MAG: pyrroline-5-carboxylate reductase [Deltaproteobacteria bacterium]|nr:pyrroline-5-carboxylate reductase [Deltaproteobacteria bacterium]
MPTDKTPTDHTQAPATWQPTEPSPGCVSPQDIDIENLASLRFAILGVGNMGLALMRGLLDAGLPAEHMHIYDVRPDHVRMLETKHGVRAAESSQACVAGSDIVLIAVKPQVFASVAAEIQGHVEDALIISIAAGIRIEKIEHALKTSRVIRAMPNTPALIGQGATALAATATATSEDVARAEQIFRLVGPVVATMDERLLDAVTGLSGSGPAYVFVIVEALADAGVNVGLPRSTATEFAVQTILGAASMLKETGAHPAQLKDQVASPGGTTIAGLAALEDGGLRGTLIRAVEAATQRSVLLGRS